jgi:hypothetical protein
MRRRSGQLWQSRGEGKADNERQGRRRQQKWVADYDKSGWRTMTKVGGGRRQKWAADYNKSGQRTSRIVGGGVRIEKGGEEAYFYL